MEEDKRFAHIKSDPKFRRIPKSEKKVKIDKRFQSMFNDKKFKVNYTVDKRGRPVSHTSKEDLKRYYDISSEEEDSDAESNDSNELKVSVKTDGNLTDAVKSKLKNLNVDYARGESALFSDSSSDDEESEGDQSETDDIDHKWGELDADADTTEESTYRLAACNMDWDRIRAVDLMVLFSSFLTAGGVIKSVVIYPSEFGKQRLQEEEVKGPIELVEKSAADEENETEEGSKYHMEKLRKYQLNRLKYYYAVITFDCPESANKVYKECDGMEYESSATKIDLRYIPDEMEFDDDPKEVCDKLPELNKYQPRFFTTTALQQAKVDLTWDETDPNRIEFNEKVNSGKADEMSNEYLKHFLAESSGNESSEDENESDEEGSISDKPGDPIEKYKALLVDIEEKENSKKSKDVEMEISWGIDLKEKTEKLVKQKISKDDEKTPFQQYLDKRREKRKEKKALKKKSQEDSDDSDMPSDIDMNDPYFAEEFNKEEFKKKNKKPVKEKDDSEDGNEGELELLLNEDDDKKHFSLKSIQEQETSSTKKGKKRKKGETDHKTDDFQVNVNDDRFSALFTSHHYNIDPTDPHYKKTKAMETLIQEKLKRRTDSTSNGDVGAKKAEKKRDPELSLLVKSVKRKTQRLKH